MWSDSKSLCKALLTKRSQYIQYSHVHILSPLELLELIPYHICSVWNSISRHAGAYVQVGYSRQELSYLFLTIITSNINVFSCTLISSKWELYVKFSSIGMQDREALD